MKNILTILFLAFSLYSFSQNKNQSAAITAEKQKSILQIQYEIDTLKANNDSLQQKVSDGKHALEYAEATYSTAQKVFTLKDNLFFGGLTLISVIIALISLFGLRNWIKNIVNSKVMELSKENTKELQRLITNEKWGLELRNRVKLIVINKLGTGLKSEIVNIIDDFGFVSIDLAELSGEAFIKGLKTKKISIKRNSFTIVILDDTLTEYGKKDGVSFMEEIKRLNIGVILYGESKLPDYELKAFAKNPYSFYNNIMQLMKYMDFKER